MQIDRLFGIVYLLLDRNTATAKELAEHFEVSVRTILRDIETLSKAGVPIYTTQGKGGGISLLEHCILNKTTISREEQDQILFALQSLSSTEHINATRILSRLRTFFHKTDTNWIEVDFSRWGYQASDKKRFEALKQAIIDKQIISFSYPDWKGQISKRKVYPLKLIFKSKAWYLQSFCLIKQDYRIFKITRMLSITISKENFVNEQLNPPPIEAPDPTYHRVIHLQMKFSPQTACRVFDEFDPENIIHNTDGSFLVTVDVPEDEWLYAFILSFGTVVYVVEPVSLRGKLLNRIQDIRNYYLSEIT